MGWVFVRDEEWRLGPGRNRAARGRRVPAPDRIGAGLRLLACLLLSAVLASHAALASPSGGSKASAPQASFPSGYAMRHWDTDDGLPSHTITDIKQAPDGYLWMATTAGLIRFDGHRFAVFDQRNAGLTNPRISILRLTQEGGILVFADDQTTMESRTTAPPWFTPRAHAHADDADLIDPKEALSQARASGLLKPGPGWTSRLVDRFGHVWLQAQDAVEARKPDGSRVWSHTFPIGTRIKALTEDAEGDLWIGTLTDGLYRIRPVAFQVYGEDSGIEDTGVTDAAPSDDGSVLLVSARGALYRLRDDRATSTVDGSLGTFRDRHGAAWFLQGRLGPDGRPGVEIRGRNHAEGSGRTITVSPVVGLLHLFEAPGSEDVLWGRDSISVYRFDLHPNAEAKAERLASAPDVRDALVDGSGALWVASSLGLGRIRGSERTLYTVEDGLPTNQTRSLHMDEDGSLWIGTYGGGIVRLRGGRFQTLDESQGLAENVVNTILEDGDGNFWMSGNRGIHRASRRQIGSVLDGREARIDSILYGRPSGLTNPESSGHPGVTDASGRFWFPMFYGLARLDPRVAIALENTPIHVTVEEVRSVPEAVHGGGRDGFRIPPGQSSLEIDYTAITLRDPENLRFQYLLEGYDSEWVEAGKRRTASFTRIPPGPYRFRVRAFVTPGRWIEAGTPIPLEVMPAFHQTGWFKALVAAAVIAAAFLAYRARTGVLRRLAFRLEKTVEERTSELAREKETVARQVEQLQDLERAKSRFFANVSHEFRTPLTLIQGPLEDLQQGLHGDLREDVNEQLDIATRSSHRLLQLVDQLLDVARAESGRLSLQARRGDYRLFLRRMAGALAPLAERKGIELTTETPDSALPLWFDPEHLEKVLLNVVGNAVKFTPSGGHVRVTVREERDGAPGTGAGSGWLVTEVEDDGPGITEEDLPKIFDRFHRGGDRAGRSQPGAGIGLALARELTTLHGGTITASSREGHGSVFTIRLPRGRAHLTDTDLAPEDETDVMRPVGSAPHASTTDSARPPAAAAGVPDAARDRGRTSTGSTGALAQEIELEAASRGQAASTGAGGDGDTASIPIARGEPASGRPPLSGLLLDTDLTTVLVADDNEEVRRYVRTHLEHEYRVLEASDGREALALARRAIPDLVVSDVMMPVMDGLELCRAIKSDPELEFIPVILLTARASSDSRVEGLEGGADDYVTKPFNLRELVARIRNLIASRRRFALRTAGAPLTIPPGTVKLESSDTAFLDQVRAAIEAHLGDEEFDAEVLARAVGASRATLYRRLRDLLGQSPMGLIRRVRLEQAAGLLARGEGSIGEIAYAVGFRSFTHFSATFREQYGSTPTAYRRTKGAAEPPAV